MNGSVMIDSAYVESEIKKEIESARKREHSFDLDIALAAGAQKAALQRVLDYVEKLKAKSLKEACKKGAGA